MWKIRKHDAEIVPEYYRKVYFIGFLVHECFIKQGRNYANQLTVYFIGFLVHECFIKEGRKVCN
jgi:hypothetical protein